MSDDQGQQQQAQQNNDAGNGGQGKQGAAWTAPASQDELNRIIADRLSRERAKFSDYDDLKAKASKLDQLDAANKTELEKAADRAAAAEKREQEAAEKAAGAELRALRIEIAAEKGLTPAQGKRLVGATRDELVADADELLKTFTPGTPSFDGGARKTAAAPQSMDSVIRKAAGY